MASSGLVLALIAIAVPLILHVWTRARRRRHPVRLPPGSLGLPFVGQSLGFLRAMRGNTTERWFQERVDRYGPVSKLSLFGTPTVFMTGPAANKLVFFSDALSMQQPRSVERLLGADNQRLRGALAEFLKPDTLRLYVPRIEREVLRHLDEHWAGRARVAAQPLMKRLTFGVIASLLFGLDSRGGAARDGELAAEFPRLLEGLWSVPVNLPFTAFRRSLRASARMRRVLGAVARETRAKLARGEASRSSDLVACMLAMTDHRGAPLLTEEEVVDNAIVSLAGGHDTTSVLLTFMIRQLAKDPDTLAAVVREHDEVAKRKGEGEALTWEDLASMKFTWRVAQETLRLVPPVFGGFRTAVRDIEFGGYTIPRGWRVFWTAGATHLDGGIFPDPAGFHPSRFENQPPAPQCSFVPFGAGRRICPGMEFARVETLVTMHHLVRRFRWSLCCKDDAITRDPLPTLLHGLPIMIQERN